MNRRSAAVMNWRNRTKLRLIDYKGGKCEKCGYNKKIPASYDFHHKIPSEKDFAIGGKGWSFDRLKQEVDKCALLCGNCHSELHYEETQKSRQLRMLEVKSGKRLEKKICEQCGESFQPRRATNKFCCLECAKMSQYDGERPTKEQLEMEMKQNTWVALGKKYGVSNNAIKKWAIKYGLR